MGPEGVTFTCGILLVHEHVILLVFPSHGTTDGNIMMFNSEASAFDVKLQSTPAWNAGTGIYDRRKEGIIVIQQTSTGVC